jgi:hypothetical protein
VPRLRRTAFAIGTAASMAAAFAAAMTAPASAQTTTSAAVLAPATAAGAATVVKLAAPDQGTYDCSDGDGFTGAPEFWRCTGTNPTSPWVGSSCTPNEYNAGSSYNVYAVDNYCSTRVWLHQYTYPTDENSNGWAFCVPPYGFPDAQETISSPDQNPKNIMVSNNVSDC